MATDNPQETDLKNVNGLGKKTIVTSPPASVNGSPSKFKKDNWAPLGTYRDSLTFMMSWDEIHR
ncbi:MAG: hypothetical protein K2X66_18765 [Cyanobacteria bacterium]|nr:hypothetical protein [Cyanobacteriota bacterium]